MFSALFKTYSLRRKFSFHSVPQKSPNPNGIKCPACFNEDDISCEPVLLTCTGAETKCLTVIGQGMDILPGVPLPKCYIVLNIYCHVTTYSKTWQPKTKQSFEKGKEEGKGGGCRRGGRDGGKGGRRGERVGKSAVFK